ncbi:MAG: SynChlorMet cassette protein ScmC [Methanotrichaceae archaeon]|nr:SynChlorMet cassette protein ScmC [Methanotrichaceae archaeon]
MIKDRACESYAISLADGQSWKLTADSSAEAWLRSAARIMKLCPEELESAKTIFFYRNDSQRSNENREDYSTSFLDWQTLGAIRIRSKMGDPFIECELAEEIDEILDYLCLIQATYPIYCGSIDKGGLPLHAALIVHQGRCLAIAAPGGTGKSTCCKRIPEPWQALCDDEVLVTKDVRGEYQAHPFPTWSEYLWQRSAPSWDVQQHFPMAGFFVLQRSEENYVSPIRKSEAANFIYQSSYQILLRSSKYLSDINKNLLRRHLFDNACQIAKSVPAFRLHVSLTGDFWSHIEEALPRSVEVPCIAARV